MASYSDNFDRANGDIGAAWVEDQGDTNIVSNRAEAVTVENYVRARYNSEMDSSDHYAQADCWHQGAGAPLAHVTCRQAGSTFTCYSGDYHEEEQNEGFRLYKYIDWAETLLDTGASGNVEQTIRLTVDGATQSVEADEVEVCSDTDSDVTEGTYCGIKGWGEYSSWNDWSAADLAAPAEYSLVCEGGSFSLGGIATALLKSSVIVPDPGSFVFTGTAAGVLKSSLIVADPDSFALSGQTIDPLKSSLIVADAASYLLVGQVVALLKSGKIDIEAASYILTGQAATLTKERVIDIAAGSYALTGQLLDLLKSGLIVAGPGAYVLTGFDVDLVYAPGEGVYIPTYRPRRR